VSFVVTVYVPEAIVMASDSRQFLTLRGKNDKGKAFKIETENSDASYKTFLLPRHAVGISSYGESLLGGISIESHVRSFSEEELEDSDDVAEVAKKLLTHIRAKFQDADTSFHVAGFKKEDGASIPHVYHCSVRSGEVARANLSRSGGRITYGARWGGQADVLSRLRNATHVKGDDGQPQEVSNPRIVWNAMNVQDAIDFGIYAVRTTIDTMRFEARAKTVGGFIDVLLITPLGASWIQRKELRGHN
jgi:hypothetical protein